MTGKVSYLSRSRVERVIAAVRVVLAGSSLFAVWLDPAEPHRYSEITYRLHAGFLAYALVVSVFIWRLDYVGRWRIGTAAIDIAFASVLQSLTMGPSSPFFVYFVFALFSAALRWGWRGTIRTAVVVSVVFIAMGAWLSHTLRPDEFELNRFIIRLNYLQVVTVVLTYLGLHEEQARTEVRRLAGWPPTSGGSVSDVVARTIAYAGEILGADRCALVWSLSDEPWSYVAWSSNVAPGIERYAPGALEPLVTAGRPDRAFLCIRASRGAIRLHVSGEERAVQIGAVPVHHVIASRLGPTLASAPFRTESVAGRVFLSGFSDDAPDILPLIEIVARDMGWSLDQALAAERERQMAIADARIRVARDLHDGVLQSLTGIRLELQALAGQQETSADLRDRLVGMERALALEQRELRYFIQDLAPAKPIEVHGQTLPDRLDDLRRRIALEWRTQISIAVDPNLAVPAELDRTIPLMVHEGIVNALKHGHPSRVVVDIRRADGVLRISINDDGQGFGFVGRQDHADLAATNQGPVSLRERVGALGGRISVDSASGGSTVNLILPLEAALG